MLFLGDFPISGASEDDRMKQGHYPLLEGKTLFRAGEEVYINRSTELEEYCNRLHRHDFIEIAYVSAGSGIHIVGDQQYRTGKGDLFVIHDDVPHGFFADPGRGAENPVVYNCVFTPKFIDASLLGSSHFSALASSFLFKSLFPREYTPIPDLSLQGVELHEVGELFGKMYQEYQAMRKGYLDLIRAYLIELIIKIFRAMELSSARNPSPQHRQMIGKAIDYLKGNYNTQVKLEDLAVRSFISKNYFSKLFKEVSGLNFSDYIQKLRIEEACHLLQTTDLKVIDIAAQVGIKDLKFFYEVFKKITGRTPGDYRKGQ
ncbi:AraC-like DNA-binding protein [Hydrogenispora ethanolica]|uniref:AraC-like DNA-binding protein n=2 Tax=Hydrogenispora ethanolica TaxID=1082276 RepID=A0A4R1SB46_HYDET|nr:AraC-like DNA-binding protein [Hydrogenispora ethanolica]